MRLEKVAVVTEGPAGIGAAVACMFVEAGARVVIADIDDAAGSKLAGPLGGSARFRAL